MRFRERPLTVAWAPVVTGLGIDLAEVARIQASLDRYGSRFLGRVYSPREQGYCMSRRNPAQHLAARFAAKEAAAKALGTGISRGVGWHDFEVTREPGEPPGLLLSGRAESLAADRGVLRISLSLSHTDVHATAIVIFEGDTPP